MTEGFNPYGLTPPARLILPDTHRRRGITTRTIRLGESAQITIKIWSGCEPYCPGLGEHEPGRHISLEVQCDSLPHCVACECGSKHLTIISGEVANRLTEALS